MNTSPQPHRVTRAVTLGVLAGALVLASAAPASSAEQTAKARGEAKAQPPKAADSEKDKSPVDPAVIAELERMGAFLRQQDTFSVRAETTTDELLDNGQKVQFGGTVDLWASRPNRLRVDIATDRAMRSLFYDGKTFTQYGADTGYYATFPAPPTVGELLDVAEQRYGIEVPLIDLFRWGTYKSDLSTIQSATDIGPSNIQNTVCEHFAFRQKDVDWQVWIARGDKPVPRKLVVTTLDEKSQPQHTSVLGWNLDPKLEDKAFRFEPPKGAKPVVFEVFDASGKPLRPSGKSLGPSDKLLVPGEK